uniref:Uncharacterized protein n=1 Tax=Glossina brevipalpis TaxID=37001 RepID=A0A1A9WL67_9MUSC
MICKLVDSYRSVVIIKNKSACISRAPVAVVVSISASVLYDNVTCKQKSYFKLRFMMHGVPSLLDFFIMDFCIYHTQFLLYSKVTYFCAVVVVTMCALAPRCGSK